jgi:hypothetical protein
MDEIKEKGKQGAQSLRVPVPNTNIPFVGHVDSLALKQVRFRFTSFSDYNYLKISRLKIE